MVYLSKIYIYMETVRKLVAIVCATAIMSSIFVIEFSIYLLIDSGAQNTESVLLFLACIALALGLVVAQRSQRL